MAGKALDHRQRLECCLAGERPDRIPVALWRHFPVDDQTPDGLASVTLAFQNLYDFDLVKVTPPSSFCLKDWGAVDRWKGNTEGTREYELQVVQYPDDWCKLPLLNPHKGHLGAQLTCLNSIVKATGDRTPILQTIFSPLAQAKNLVGGSNLLVHIRKYPDAVHAGLKCIQESILRFLDESMKCGISGIFYAIQHAQYGLLSEKEYLEFGKQYDLPILEAARDLWLNMLHLHGEHVMFQLVSDLPVQVINWHDQHTKPNLMEARHLFPGVLCGGLRRWETMTIGTPSDVRREAREAITVTGGRKFILGTGCVLPIIAPHGNIMSAIAATSE
ncbi:MAG TPA: uroporphyrinogen decarboxylase family protein [Anaerolineaceae bacterium]